MEARTDSRENRLAQLKSRADDLTARMEYAYGPEKVLLSYERGVVLYQQRWSYESESRAWLHAQQEARQSPPSIHNSFWEVETLIVPTISGVFKTWLWETLDGIVTDYAQDWLVHHAQPGNAVLIRRHVADKRALEVSSGVWIIDVDVEGTVIWCDPGACDPEVDARDVIMLTKQVLESALSFKIVPTDESTVEVRFFCGARQLGQQFYEAKHMIMNRWPLTKVLQADTDVSFRGATKKVKPVIEEERAVKKQELELHDSGILHASFGNFKAWLYDFTASVSMERFQSEGDTGRYSMTLEPAIELGDRAKELLNLTSLGRDALIDPDVQAKYSPARMIQVFIMKGQYHNAPGFPTQTEAIVIKCIRLDDRLDNPLLELYLYSDDPTVNIYAKRLAEAIKARWKWESIEDKAMEADLRKRWAGIETTPESFYIRLVEAVQGFGERRLELSDSGHAILGAKVDCLVTGGRQASPNDPISFGVPLTYWHTSSSGESQFTATQHDQGIGIQFDVRRRKGGRISVIAECKQPFLANAFRELVIDIEQAILNEDWPDVEPAQSAYQEKITVISPVANSNTMIDDTSLKSGGHDKPLVEMSELEREWLGRIDSYLRRGKGMTLEAFADKIGFSPATITLWLRKFQRREWIDKNRKLVLINYAKEQQNSIERE